jgi:hypothetical protein
MLCLFRRTEARELIDRAGMVRVKNLREVALELLLVPEQPELDVVAFITGAGGVDRRRRRLVVVPGKKRAVAVLRFHLSSAR